jgi:hypothetical protein
MIDMQISSEMLHCAAIRSAKTKGLRWSLFFLWATLIGLFWHAEEPSKFNTFAAVFVVFTLAVTFICMAKRWGIIESMEDWMLAFMLAMTVVPLTLHYAWIMTEIVQDYNGPDPVRFDSAAREIITGRIEFSLLKRSVNFPGVLYYIVFIYQVFGISTLYVSLFNLLFCLITFLFITKMLIDETGVSEPWQKMRWGMLLPLVVYNTVTPGKDILAMTFLVLSICSMRHLINRRSIVWFVIMTASLLCLIAVRGSALFLVILAALAFIILRVWKRRFLLVVLPSVIILLMVAFIAPMIVELLGGTPFQYTELFDMSQKVEFSEFHSVGGSLNLLFTPRSNLQLLLFTPIRTVFLLVAPFPNLHFFAETKGAEWFCRYASVESLIILLAFPGLIAATFDKHCRRQNVYGSVVVVFWILLAAISMALFIIHERYRLMVMPFGLAAVLVGVHYGKPKRYIVPSFLLANLGFVLYALLKVINPY